MENTYLLKIDQLYIKPIHSIEDDAEIVDVITRVDFHYEATSPAGTVKKYRVTSDLSRPQTSEGFLTYKDVTYEQIQDWVRLPEMQQEDVYSLLSAQIKEAEDNEYVKPDLLPWEIQILESTEDNSE